MKEKIQKSEKETSKFLNKENFDGTQKFSKISDVEKLAGEIKQESKKIIKEEKKLEEKEKKQTKELEDLKKQLDEAKKLAEERLNQLKYLHADFDNYKKRFEKEKEQIIKLANESLIKELIVILDDFEASIKLIEEEKNREGLLMLQKKFFQILETHGLKKIEALGKKIDPEFHEVLCKELSEREDGSILEEIQKGYLLCAKVIRPSKVKVSKCLKSEKFENNKEK